MTLDCVAELSGVSKHFSKIVALEGVDLQVRRGELLAVLGPNGAGKTTAISLMLGLQQPDAGTVRLFGESPRLLAPRRQIGAMMQEVNLVPELRVQEWIHLASSYYPSPYTTGEVLKMTHTESLACRPYGKLSAGQKRQVQFAVALCGRPQLLFLDEPTAGLDIQTREAMWTELRRLVDEGRAVVLTTHYLEEAEALADRVTVLARGHVVAAGSVDDIRAHVARKRISCSTNLSVKQIASWPGVESVSCDRHLLHITASDAEAIVRRLMAADENLRELEVRRAGLAEAFTELTKEAV